MADVPFVSAVVPVRDGERTIGDCLVSLRGSDYLSTRREIVVVDNGSSDRTAAIVQAFPDVRYIREPRVGAAHARNRGIRESVGEIIAFTDADCVVSRGWLNELVAGFDRPEVGGVAGEIRAFPPCTPAERYMAMRHPNWQQRALGGAWPYAATANVAFRRSTFDKIGLFDTRLISGEDKDLSWRLLQGAELEFGYRPKAVVLHRHESTARAFMQQHMVWSHGNALLHAKYGIPWGLKDEIRKYLDLVDAVWALSRASTRYAVAGGPKAEVYTTYFEMLRRLTYRLGGLRWLLTRRALRARFVADGDTCAEGGRRAGL